MHRRYVSYGGSRTSYSFVVPKNGCGTKPACKACGTVENILIIQADDTVQEIWDTARKVSCANGDLTDTTQIAFKPFMVDMLEVVNVPTTQGSVECWMDIQKGVYPNVC
jgi:hypothetical protein